jgi:putative PIN family toxin of toxin-antitoxin system
MSGKTVNLVLDTNVFISALFFSGIPYRILDAWRNGRVRLFVSRAILDEYLETGIALAKEFKHVDIAPWISLLEAHATIIDPEALPAQVCTDPDDDMFIACALAAHAHIICSGDKALLKASGYRGVEIIKPREFVDRYLPQ